MKFDFSRVPVTTDHSGDPLPFLDTIQWSFGHHDLAHVRARTDCAAAAAALAVGAEAFTRGSTVTFARTPSLYTAAHEAAHVIQQRTGVGIAGGIGRAGDEYEKHADEVADRVVRGQSSEALLDAPPGTARLVSGAVQGVWPMPHVTASRIPVVQLRRIPPNVLALLSSSANAAANVAGMERLIELAMSELAPVEQAIVMINRLGPLSEAEFNALPHEEQLSKHAAAIVALFPAAELGDPKLIDTGPRPATADAANITKVVTNADTIFNSIATGVQDGNITQVFGAANVATAKAKYAAGRKWMNKLNTANKIVTDRSGYSGEVSQGGLTGFHEIIRLHPDVIDSPDDHDSIVTLMHESLHAGNSDVRDDIYITATGFQSQTNARKLANSAHYEVVPWRVLEPTNANAFPVTPATVPPTFQTFIPAGATVGGVTAPSRTPAEKGAIAAYEKLNNAWALGLNLHLVYVQLFRTPSAWKVPQSKLGGVRFDKSVPFWSKVQKLTIHLKTAIDPASPDEAKHPASQIDVALSEGFTRKLGFGMDVLSPLKTEAQILTFETAKATTAEITAAFPGGAHTDENKERDFLLELALRDPKVGSITGNTPRDLRVVQQFNAPTDAWTDILKPRNPASFAD